MFFNYKYFRKKINLDEDLKQWNKEINDLVDEEHRQYLMKLPNLNRQYENDLANYTKRMKSQVII